MFDMVSNIVWKAYGSRGAMLLVHEDDFGIKLSATEYIEDLDLAKHLHAMGYSIISNLDAIQLMIVNNQTKHEYVIPDWITSEGIRLNDAIERARLTASSVYTAYLVCERKLEKEVIV